MKISPKRIITALPVLFVLATATALLLFRPPTGETPASTGAPDTTRSESDGLRLSIITDIDHCPSRAAVSEERLDDFLEDAEARHADLIVSLGDNASHRLRKCSDTADMDARYIADRIRSAGIPAHFVLGDHDIASDEQSYQAWLATIGRETPFYSFDAEGVHVVVLDTVTGGEPLVKDCQDSPGCAEALDDRERARIHLEKAANGELSSETDSATLPELREVYERAEQRYREELDLIHDVRNASHRDRGMILDRELDWLRQDLSGTDMDRILILSDHPLFPFESDRKAYDMLNGTMVREILESAVVAGKRVVAISGEAHLWHDETLRGVDYHIVDEFRKADGSWAFFLWKEDGEPVLERILTDPEPEAPGS